MTGIRLVLTRRLLAHVAATAVCIGGIALLASAPRGQALKQMAVTFDDLPFAYPGTLTHEEQRVAVRSILDTLARHRITATMFVNGGALTNANRVRVDDVARAGHVIGSHTFSHPDLARISAEDFIRDIERNEPAIRPWLNGPQYLRYPFLRQGDTVDKRDTVLRWLREHDIRVAPVSMDNNDYLYNQRAVDAQRGGRAVNLQAEYLEHMREMAGYYDTKARQLIGRPVKQVLLLHMNYLNGLYLEALLSQFEADGWTFITFEDALTDPVYSMPYEYVGRRGAGHLDAIRPGTPTQGR